MNTLTVFTPTFNRANLLPRLYGSLIAQRSKDFEWLIVDDGSQDNTRELVEGWKMEGKINISYCYQENGGMHTAHNKAYDLIRTELNMCVDSDDYLTENAVELIINRWKCSDKNNIAGIIGLKVYDDGQAVGSENPPVVTRSGINELYRKYQVKGDKSIVLSTRVVSEFPKYPVFQNEKFVPLGTLYLLIDQKYDFIIANEAYTVVRYLKGGWSAGLLNHYRDNPEGFAYERLLRMRFSKSYKEKFKQAAHLVSSSIFLKDFGLLKKACHGWIVVAMFPLGVFLNLFIRLKTSVNLE